MTKCVYCEQDITRPANVWRTADNLSVCVENPTTDEGMTHRPVPECPICHGPCTEASEPTERWTEEEKAEWREVFRQMMKDFDRHMAERGQ